MLPENFAGCFYLANVALGSLVVCVIALIGALVAPRRTASLRLSVLLSGSLLALSVPATIWIASAFGLGIVGVPVVSTDTAGPESQTTSKKVESRDSDSDPQSIESDRTGDRIDDRIDVAMGAQQLQGDSPLPYPPVFHNPDSQASDADTLNSNQTDVLPALTGTSPARLSRLSILVGLVWAFGTVVLAIRLGLGLASARKLRRTLRISNSPRLRAKANLVSRALGLRRALQVFESDDAPSPLTLGVFNSVIVLPSSLPEELSDAELQAVLTHEAAHVARFDCMAACLQQFAVIFFWWNPLLHLVNRWSYRLREFICDDYVVSLTGTGENLAEALVIVAETCVEKRQRWPATATLFEDHEQLVRRVNRLTDRTHRPAQPGMGVKSLCWIAIFGLLSLIVASTPGLRLDRLSATEPLPGEEDRGEERYNSLDGNDIPFDPASAFIGAQQTPSGDGHTLTQLPKRGIAVVSSSIGTTLSVEEILSFAESCRLQFVVIDFAWITHHWDRTTGEAVRLAKELAKRNIGVGVMYRPRTLRPDEADIHYLPGPDGKIRPSHNHPDLRYDDSINWATNWGSQLLDRFPMVDTIILYNLFGDQKAVADFLSHCRNEWGHKRDRLLIGHVGGSPGVADVVDIWFPFVPVNGNHAETLDALHTVRTSGKQIPNQRAVIPFLKTDWGRMTKTSTLDVMRAIEACEREKTGFQLWHYDHLFNSPEQFEPEHIAKELGADWKTIRVSKLQSTRQNGNGGQRTANQLNEWVAFRSREDATSDGARILVTSHGQSVSLKCSADTVLISYLADKPWGRLPILAVDRKDVNRSLLSFPLDEIRKTDGVERAVLRLPVTKSSKPLTAPLKVRLSAVKQPWDEATATWNNPPAFSNDQIAAFTVSPDSKAVEVDVTEHLRQMKEGTDAVLSLMLSTEKDQIAGGSNSPDDQQASREWIAFESRESDDEGQPWLELTRGKDVARIGCKADTTVISYLADRATGSSPQIAASRNGTSRILLAFPVESIGDIDSLDRVVLHLRRTKSTIPITTPLVVHVFDPTSEWNERTTTWQKQPTYGEEHVARFTVDPTDTEIKVDVTALIRRAKLRKGGQFDLMFRAPEKPIVPAPIRQAPGHSSVPPDLALPPREDQFESLPWPHQPPNASPEQIARINNEIWIINDNPLYQSDRTGSWRYFHGGLDIVLPNGTPIYAMKDGWVRSAERDTVTVADFDDDKPCFGWEYTHIGDITVRRGQQVKRGDKLGVVNFRGLEHLHLTKVYSQSPWWGEWTWTCYPNAHFPYTDTKPPIIEKPFYFFRNNTEQLVARSDEDDVIVSGDIDIVVPIHEAGEYAAGGPANIGNRLGVTRIEYDIRPANSKQTRRFQSFDFTVLRFRKGFAGRVFGTELTRHVYKHWGLFESEQDRRRKFNSHLSSYYIITNSPPDASPITLSASTSDHSWSTRATTAEGTPQFPDGPYVVTVRAYDFKGLQAESSVTVSVRNEE